MKWHCSYKRWSTEVWASSQKQAIAEAQEDYAEHVEKGFRPADMDAAPMGTWWRFAGYNEQAQYGFGAESEAQAWVERMNAEREINHASYSDVWENTNWDDENDRYAWKCLEDGDAGFNLADALAEIKA